MYGQTAWAHKAYFDYVFSIFMPFCAKDYAPQLRVVRDNRTKKIYSAISFPPQYSYSYIEVCNSLVLMYLKNCFMFYPPIFDGDVKKVPDNIYDLLTPRGLAFWIIS